MVINWIHEIIKHVVSTIYLDTLMYFVGMDNTCRLDRILTYLNTIQLYENHYNNCIKDSDVHRLYLRFTQL